MKGEGIGKFGLFWMKLGLFLGFLAIVFVAIAVSKEVYQKNKIEAEIKKLREEAEKVIKENSQLQERISYFETPDYQEREAKDKLGLQKPDENVVVIKPGINKGTPEEESVSPPVPDNSPKVPNPQKWWNYFFGMK